MKSEVLADAAAAAERAAQPRTVCPGMRCNRCRPGSRRYPVLNRARRVLWLATCAEKRDMLARQRAGDASIPARRVLQHRALLLADRAAVAP